MTRDFLAPLLIILLFFSSLMLLTFLMVQSENTTISGTDISDKNSLHIVDQRIHNAEVVAERVSLESPGFVVVRKSESGTPGRLMGKSAILDIGTHEDIIIRMDEIGDAERVFYASLYRDNGDGEFSPGEDKPIFIDGKVLQKRFTVEKVGFFN